VVEAHRERIRSIALEHSGIHADQPLTAELVTYLRQVLEDRAEAELGLAHTGYVQRRLWRLVDALVGAWAGVATVAEPTLGAAAERAVAAWWTDEALQQPAADRWRLHRQQSFLEHFDVSYRIRRIEFLIRRINELEADRAMAAATVEALDAFKQLAYGFTERCFHLRRAERLDERLLLRLREAAADAPLSAAEARALLTRVADALGLEALDREFDGALADLLGSGIERAVRDGLVADYVGFPFFDVLLLGPGSLDDGPDPLTSVRVDRISPADARLLAGEFDGLHSRELLGFLGFFNRTYREHDYLWGRLNGAERLVDLLTQVAGAGIGDPRALKLALFEAILAAERERLPGCAAHLDALTRAVRELA